ncbi:MAG: patatin-like phospholipase family protein [Pseudomonadota bacterium]
MFVRNSLAITLSSFKSGAVLAPALAVTLCACTPFNYIESDAPKPLASVPVFEPKPRIALVLGAGGPRGYAHIGVMRVLEQACINVDLIVGTSVGSLLGTFWASGLSATQIDALSTQGGPLTLFDPSLFADRGWIHGQKLQDFVNRELGGKKLEELPRKVIVVATQREEKSTRYFVSGNTGVAVRASSAVPGIISPVGINGTEYEDGDVTAPLAVSAARAAGAEFVIAVNVYPKTSSIPTDASDRSREQVERRASQTASEMALADFAIHAETPFKAGPNTEFFKTSREIGEKVAASKIHELLAALEQRQIGLGSGCS